MCIAALSAKAQVLTSETVKNGYETVVNMPESGYVFNADYTEDDITTMYVYQKTVDRKDILLYTVSAHQRDTGHGNSSSLCRAVTVRPCVWLSCSHVRDSCSR